MKVAFLTHEPFYPPSGGGSAEAVYLAREMMQRGHAVHLFCPAFPEPDRIKRLFAGEPVPGKSHEETRSRPRASGVCSSRGVGSEPSGEIECHLFTAWPMGRYT